MRCDCLMYNKTPKQTNFYKNGSIQISILGIAVTKVRFN